MAAALQRRRCEYPTYYPHNGWAEQDPEDSWKAFVSNIRELIAKSSISPDDVAAISLDAATHTAVLLDDHDRPVRNAIYWTDTRSSAEAAELREAYGDEITRLHKRIRIIILKIIAKPSAIYLIRMRKYIVTCLNKIIICQLSLKKY